MYVDFSLTYAVGISVWRIDMDKDNPSEESEAFYRRLINPVSRDKLNEEYKDRMDTDDREDSDTSSGEGERSEKWFTRINSAVKKNTDATMHNRRMLVRVDERTAWIAKIILIILASLILAIGAGIALSSAGF